jgi:hypothetical protein
VIDWQMRADAQAILDSYQPRKDDSDDQPAN